MKLLRILADLTPAVIGLVFAWIVFTGSARTIGLYLIIFMSVVFIIREWTKEEE